MNVLRAAGWIALMRVRIFTRTPDSWFFSLVVPVLLSLILASAFSPEAAPVKVVTLGDPLMAERLDGEPLIDAVAVPSAGEGEARVRGGRADVMVVPGERPRLVVSAGSPDSRWRELVVSDALERAAGRRSAPHVERAELSSQGSRYVDFLVPGLLGYSLLNGSLFGIGNAIVEMRIGRLLKRLRASPMPRASLLLGLMGGQVIQALMETLAFLSAARLLFGVRCAGNPVLLVAFVVLASVCFGGLSVLIASRARTLDGANGLMQLFNLPMVVVSGVFFSAQRFPERVQPFLRWVPLRAALDGLRAVLLDGAGTVQIAQPVLVLAVWGAIGLLLGTRLFRWS